MLMETRVTLDTEAHLHPKNIAVQEGEHGVASSTPIHILPQQPGMLVSVFYISWVI